MGERVSQEQSEKPSGLPNIRDAAVCASVEIGMGGSTIPTRTAQVSTDLTYRL